MSGSDWHLFKSPITTYPQLLPAPFNFFTRQDSLENLQGREKCNNDEQRPAMQWSSTPEIASLTHRIGGTEDAQHHDK